ncbi:hypothetical protein CLV24_102254 [Pontibacter ummariensis]|uniref:Uncharacterized protein n=1 Tax=Pontibacter ummariensis TaxID=1610492 RepID=A0A239BUP4_9BACT|nr:hypothetical protein [Pontibacter ummariensis]PRY15632.1 hypothetical protein CLV24_102254 [Pontibacter ummariensis]SNS11141.1 hypothetical protein SAMN06296052_102158 [Pontibacter ummariensis]
MAGLQAEEMNNEFLKNFMPETLYWVDGDLPVPQQEPAPAPLLKSEAEPAAALLPPATVTPAERQQTEPEAKKATPAIPKVPKAPVPVASPAKYKVQGENGKGVIVLVTVSEEEFLKLPQLGFLQKILFAIGLQTTDVAYVNNISGAIAQFEELQQVATTNYIISFASRLHTDLPHEKFTLYQPVEVGNVPVVFSQALSMLEHDVEHKKMLWGALQKVFL